MANGVTSTLGLTLGTDERQNDNWRKLDTLVANLAARNVIPGDLLVDGNLEVTGTSTLTGPVTTPSIDAGTINTGSVIQAGGLVTANAGIRVAGGNFQVDSGNVIFPDQSLNGADLMKGATVQGIWVGAPVNVGSVITPNVPTKLAEVATDASEETDRWTLIVAQVTLRLNYGTPGNPYIPITLTLRRGNATDLQTRFFEYASSAPLEGLDLDIPLTMFRVMQISAGLIGDRLWSVWATVNPNTGGQVLQQFAQLYALQLR